jgi:hypothetical protein
MKYFFSSPSGKLMKEVFDELGVENYLLSYAVDGKHCKNFKGNIIIDSGAFTVWNSGKGEINIKDYANFIKGLPEEYEFINLDVIPKTGSSEYELDQACEASYENFLFLKESQPHIMPVFHYGDDFKWLTRYLQDASYIGISPANDTSEFTKRKWLDEVYSRIQFKVKTHALGYSSLNGMLRYPFYSVDSISYKRAWCYNGPDKYSRVKVGFLSPSRVFKHFLRDGVKRFLQIEKKVTDRWKARNVWWES